MLNGVKRILTGQLKISLRGIPYAGIFPYVRWGAAEGEEVPRDRLPTFDAEG